MKDYFKNKNAILFFLVLILLIPSVALAEQQLVPEEILDSMETSSVVTRS